jgi:hypothetical protein
LLRLRMLHVRFLSLSPTIQASNHSVYHPFRRWQ